jgi:kumamolisin
VDRRRTPFIMHVASSLRASSGMVGRFLIAVALAVDILAAAAGQTPRSFAAPEFSTFAGLRQSVPAYAPAQIETAYDIAPLLQQGIDGTGETIALIELDRFEMSDIQQFDARYQLPNPTVDEFYPAGQPFTLPRQGETTMDLEWAHALAPGAKIQVYYLKSNQANAAGWRTVASAVDTAVANGAGTISLSFGVCRASQSTTVAQQAFARALSKGVTVFVSSGDSGAYPGPVRDCGKQLGVGYPAADPSVISVGGTSLLLNPDNTIGREIAWRLSGGGKGKPMLRPLWQMATSLKPGRYRYAPDVSFLGDPSTGAAIFYRGAWRQAGGTSLGAPAWAGIWSLVRQDAQQSGKTLPPTPSLLYRIGNSPSYAQAFHDIMSGSNGRYNAGAGWDSVTGWGTPDANRLATTILAISSSARVSPGR